MKKIILVSMFLLALAGIAFAIGADIEIYA
jgi:hypothetical protein